MFTLALASKGLLAHGFEWKPACGSTNLPEYPAIQPEMPLNRTLGGKMGSITYSDLPALKKAYKVESLKKGANYDSERESSKRG